MGLVGGGGGNKAGGRQGQGEGGCERQLESIRLTVCAPRDPGTGCSFGKCKYQTNKC